MIENNIFRNVKLPFSSSDYGTNTFNPKYNLTREEPLFVNFPESGADAYSPSYDFHLKTGSPAIKAGSDGKDLGIYGGDTPFVPAGVSLPLIQLLTVPTQIPVGEDLEVKIKAKSY